MYDEEAFLQAIRTTPDDPTVRLVYADWLEERGDPRGEYLRLEHQLAQIPLRLAELRKLIDEDWLRSVTPAIKGYLRVLRGAVPNIAHPLYEGRNVIGRADEAPVDIDLSPQEYPERIWSLRQHATVTWDQGVLVLEDLISANTYLNRQRVYPHERPELHAGDVIQIGYVQLKVFLLDGK
jgi:uncharacterized protein (TIGR02996 family)